MEVIRAWGGNKDIGVPVEQRKKTLFLSNWEIQGIFRELKKKENIFVCSCHTGDNQRQWQGKKSGHFFRGEGKGEV